MSQFRSLRGRGNYAYAGKVAADDALRSFIAARESSPDYGKLAQEAANIRSAEKIAAIKAQTKVAKTGIAVKADLRSTEILSDAKADAKKSVRKAGLLAAAGRSGGIGLMKLGEKPLERRDSSKLIDRYNQRIEDLETKAGELRNGTTSTSNSTDENNTGDQQGGNSAGKVSTAPLSSTIPKTGEGWQRLSRVIHVGEGTTGDKGYTTLFGGGQFTDLSKHPDQVVSASGYNSSAAGKYQFLTPTWNEARDALGLKDFSPESQEKAGRFLTQRRGVDPDKVYTNFNDFKDAIDKLAPEWASLPYSKTSPKGFGNGSSYYGQGGIDINEAWRIYNQ